MRRLDLCDSEDVPKLKGKVACQISAADELVTTELLFQGVFRDLDYKQLGALCSCLVFTDFQQNQEGKLKNEDLQSTFAVL